MSVFCCILQGMRKEINKEKDMCSKCGKIPAKVNYKNKKYCTWYCAKKESKQMMEESIWGYVILIVVCFIGLVYQGLKEIDNEVQYL